MSVMEADTQFCHVHGRVHAGEDMWGEPDVGPCLPENWPVVEGEVVNEEVQSLNLRPNFTLKRGDLAFINTLSGLVPCKVLSISDEGAAIVKVTAARPGWKRGMVEHFASPKVSLLKRTQVHTRGGESVIRGALTVYTDEGVLL